MVRPQRLQKEPAFNRLMFVVCLTSWLLIASSLVSAEENLKPKSQEWQINGILEALDDGCFEVKNWALGKLVEFDAQDLAALPKQLAEIVQKTSNLVKDSFHAINALRNLGKADAGATQFLIPFINDSTASLFLRTFAIEALGKLSKTNERVVQSLTLTELGAILPRRSQKSLASASGKKLTWHCSPNIIETLKIPSLRAPLSLKSRSTRFADLKRPYFCVTSSNTLRALSSFCPPAKLKITRQRYICATSANTIATKSRMSEPSNPIFSTAKS